MGCGRNMEATLDRSRPPADEVEGEGSLDSRRALAGEAGVTRISLSAVRGRELVEEGLVLMVEEEVGAGLSRGGRRGGGLSAVGYAECVSMVLMLLEVDDLGSARTS